MTLQDIFDQLIYGELSQLALTEDNELNANDRQKLIPHIKLGLTELHKRFLLRERNVKVNMVTDQLTYVLHSDYAESNSKAVSPYLADTSDPFTDDVLKIERIFNDEDEEMILNKPDNEYSIRTTSPTTMLIPVQDPTTEYVTVYYRADHPTIDQYAYLQPANKVTINLPPGYLEPLLYYVASRVMNPIGLTPEFHEGNNYYAKFEAAVQRLKDINLDIDTEHENTKFTNRGFV